MRVHFGEARHQEAVGAVYDFGLLGNGYVIHVSNCSDDAILNHDGLRADYRFAAHRDDVHIYERGRIRLSRDCREQQNKE